MAGESENEIGESLTSTETEIKRTKKKKKKSAFSRLWGTIFRAQGDDFEERLEQISKEEAAVLNRIKKRSQRWRRITKHLLILSVLLEVIAVGYAILTTRSLDLNWKMRAVRVFPMFLLPALSSITYSALGRYTRMRDRKDHKTLEKLQTERQEKINELKEKTKYYITQQLIQKYDPDPAAKAAAATVLASKLGADSGLRVYMGDDSNLSALTGKSNDMEVTSTSGLRNRKAPLSKSSSMERALEHDGEEFLNNAELDGADISQQRQLIMEHRPQTGSSGNDGGWIARLAALLVGEDPTQSYALICVNCHMHNGLARKEDFPYITYYCPHCNALNRPKQPGEPASGSSSPTNASTTTLEEAADIVVASAAAGAPKVDLASFSNSPAAPVTDISQS